jgi:hypothetical protein
MRLNMERVARGRQGDESRDRSKVLGPSRDFSPIYCGKTTCIAGGDLCRRRSGMTPSISLGSATSSKRLRRPTTLIAVLSGILLVPASGPAGAVTVVGSGSPPQAGTVFVNGGTGQGTPGDCKYSGPATSSILGSCQSDSLSTTLTVGDSVDSGTFSASVKKTYNPSLQVSAQYNGDSGANLFVEASATYSVTVFDLLAPLLGSSVTLDIVGSFTVTDPASGGDIVIGSDYYTFTGPSSGSSVSFIGSNQLLVSTETSGTKSFDDKYETVAGQTYTLNLYADLSMNEQECCSSDQLVTVKLDPIVSIDPATPNASDFSLVFSSGFGPSGSVIPEPSTWTMMLIGFASFGFAGYRASRRTVAAS